ncbi:beta-ketoacyl-ACP synthase II [Tahibacter soli]|uniref:3-oxoacyl-[acyl-carrier-protein] synthase 2 n=1 Tax=Tahibacter soli TaxID=2983605 RepID=A0A9X3YLC5_9GAMM|nr:beta-ketoacyl-ACP synthase II [Tahibacter soli]MDC8014556.1 beta-ketoacyl-ACP synthase II [Tahibacter soli]
MDNAKRRVVVTGLGTVSPVGNDVDTAWRNVRDAVSGIGPITHFDTAAYATKIAGQVRDFDATRYMSAKEVRFTDPFIHYGVAAGRQAFDDAGLAVTPENAARIGVAIGSGIGGIGTMETTSLLLAERGPRRISPFFLPGSMINMASGFLSIGLGLEGPNLCTTTACSTATHSIGLALRTIQHGDADVMIAGGSEHSTTGTAIAGFCSARAMSTRNDAPGEASRPWDAERDGFVLSDGAGALVLEEYEHAKARGAKIYAELAGFGMSSDAYHVTAPEPSGDGARRSMRNALADAGLNPADVGYVNAHATSTELGDRAEVQAIYAAFGEHARRLAVSSTKSTTGHLLGAAGAVEAIYSVLALHYGVIPPTANLHVPGEGCDLDFVPRVARDAKLVAAISNSFGFGGTNGTLAFKKV